MIPGVGLIADNIKCFFPSSLFLQPLLSRAPLCKSYGCLSLSRLQPRPIPAGGDFAVAAPAPGRSICPW